VVPLLNWAMDIMIKDMEKAKLLSDFAYISPLRFAFRSLQDFVKI